MSLESTVYKTIEIKAFEADTLMRSPYYQKGTDGNIQQFAVCPACNNPIRILGLYKPTQISPRPFGKHFEKSIPGLAVYDKEGYEYCPYAARSRILAPDSRLSKPTATTKAIIGLLKAQFDRVAYIIQKDTGVVVTENLARKMLKAFIQSQGHLYTGATLMNIPWIFAYMAFSQSLNNRIILNAELREAILEQVPQLEFNGNQLVEKSKNFLPIEFCFIHHVSRLVENSLEENLTFCVSIKDKGKKKILYEKRVVFEHNYFQNLINMPAERSKSYRNGRLLAAAEEMLTGF